jgi:hypothetical protein
MKRKFPMPSINFDGCSKEGDHEGIGQELAHYHPDLHQICCSERQLIMQDLDDIETTATHEITHFLVQSHGHIFIDEEERSSLSGFKKPPGVVIIDGGKRTVLPNVEPRIPSKTHCNRNGCYKKKDLRKCPHCKEHYCSDHIRAKKPGHYNIDGSKSTNFIHDEEWKDNDGHPCPIYAAPMDEEDQEIEEEKSETPNLVRKKLRSNMKDNDQQKIDTEKCDFCDVVLKKHAYKCNYCKKLFCDKHKDTKKHRCNVLYSDPSQKYKVQDKHKKEVIGKKPPKEHKKPDKKESYEWEVLKVPDKKEVVNEKPKKTKKKFPFFAVILAILLIIVIVNVTKPKDCSDGTLHETCALTKPHYCIDGEFYERSDLCNCPNGERILNGECIEIIKCIDGTLSPDCSIDKPYQCVGGNLVLKASVCGCSEGQYIEGNYCKNII